jgi:hypothetical protein
MHVQVVRACGRSDYIVTELVPIIVEMLEEYPGKRPSAMRLRTKCQQALYRATKLSASKGITFLPAFRLQAETMAPSRTPEEVPSDSRRGGLVIQGSLYQMSFPPAASGSTGNSTGSILPSRSRFSGQNLIDTIIADEIPPFESPSPENTLARMGMQQSDRPFTAHVPRWARSFESPLHPDPAIQNSYYDSHRVRRTDPAPQKTRRECPNSRMNMIPHATIDEVHRLIKRRKNTIHTDPLLEQLLRLPSLQRRDQVRTL